MSGAAHGVPVDPQPLPRALRQAPFLVVVGLSLVGLGFVVVDRFRVASAVLSLAFGLATILRAVLPERDAGLLVVRSRWVDVACLATVAAALTSLTVLVPPPTCAQQPGAGAGRAYCSANLP